MGTLGIVQCDGGDGSLADPWMKDETRRVLRQPLSGAQSFFLLYCILLFLLITNFGILLHPYSWLTRSYSRFLQGTALQLPMDGLV